MTHLTHFRINLGWRNQYCGVERLERGGVVWYFIDNEYYFRREQPYGYYDDGERMAFFSKAVCECIPHLDFVPDILHCHDWHTALAPVYLRELWGGNPAMGRLRTVFTVHNLKFQGRFDGGMLGDVLGLDGYPAARDQLMHNGAVNFMRGALCYSDRITTVSPTYADEVSTDFYGEGLSDVFARRGDVLSGILNGIDVEQYDPAQDPALPVRYGPARPEGKAENKVLLQKELGLPQDREVPLVGLVSRLTDQKGLDLILRVLPELLAEEMQLVVLGVGQRKYEQALACAAGEHPEKMAACLRFDDGLSRRVYAAADLILVPSLFEPCGLSQMIAMRYGALPLVRETGGLKDSVRPYDRYTGEGNGFSFANYNAHEMLFTLQRVLRLRREEPEAWEKLVAAAFRADFSWARSAGRYLALYRELLRQ